MKNLILSHKRWQQIFDIELIIILIIQGIETVSHNWRGSYLKFFVFTAIFVCLNFYARLRGENLSKVGTQIIRWLNLIFLGFITVTSWTDVGNFLLHVFPQLEVLWLFLLWIIYIVMLLPLAVLFAGRIRNWFLALIAIRLLTDQYVALNVSKNISWLFALNEQGVIAAFSSLLIACYLEYAWGFNFNPNLKFVKSSKFQKSVLVALISFAIVDLLYNCFNNYDSNLWSVLFSYSANFDPKNFNIENFTAAIEPGIFEETIRYLDILILLAGFNRFPKWRVPIAIYGSGVLFGLAHLGNVGWHGETLTETLAQVFGVMGGGFLWAVLYLYSGKLWITMIFHFSLDYLSFLQSGWDSAGWSLSGSSSDILFEILLFTVPLFVTIWMMFGQRREVLEENADRLLNLQDGRPKYLLTIPK